MSAREIQATLFVVALRVTEGGWTKSAQSEIERVEQTIRLRNAIQEASRNRA